MTALIATEGLVAGYGDVTIIRDVDLEVRAGEVVALLGPNGAGKTTTILTLAGEIRPRSGRVLSVGLDETNKATHLRARAGLAIVTDERAVFMRMSVAENIRVFRSSVDAVVELFPELRDHLERPVALLSGGQQQMLALGLALSRQPSVILADELSLGLAPMLVDRLFEVLRQAADNGAGVLLVEQYVHKAMAIADRVYVMDRGRISITGTSEELSTRVDEIQSSYLSGTDAETSHS
jgi:ABC-type branched-subunit amino acid transport system ATPase component